MNRRISMLLLAGTLTLTLAACGAQVRESGGGDEGSQEGPLRLAVVPKAVGFDFWEQVRIGAECAAGEAEGSEIQIQWDGVTAETNVSGQVDLLTNFATQGVDGMVYAATDAKVLADVSENALDQGVTVVNIDSGTDPQPKQVPVVATDNVAAAEEATEYLVEELGGKGEVAFIPFQPGTATNDTRTEGFKNVLEENPDVELVAEQSSESDQNVALEVTENILTANPNLDAIYAANEPGVLGAAEAVRRAGKEGDITIVGWDTAPDEVKAVEEGVVSALVAQNPFRMGYDGTNAAVDAIRSDAQLEDIDTGSTLVTQDNLDDPEVKAVLNPSCSNKPEVSQ
ncbi:MAG: substrate-binding domain-containing protein [Actinomycetota bacterium]|nr:substrate-binding domain-containing protein [Actinomycetota bacterium]